jgi:hypothetical protein
MNTVERTLPPASVICNTFWNWLKLKKPPPRTWKPVKTALYLFSQLTELILSAAKRLLERLNHGDISGAEHASLKQSLCRL